MAAKNVGAQSVRFGSVIYFLVRAKRRRAPRFYC